MTCDFLLYRFGELSVPEALIIEINDWPGHGGQCLPFRIGMYRKAYISRS